MRFDSIAKYYDRLARLVFGDALIKAQSCFLKKIMPSSHVLVLGGGTGRWLNEFILHSPTSKIYYVDPSNEMIRLAKELTGDDQRITFKVGTESSLEKNEFDAVITFCFLDLFPDHNINAVIDRIKEQMKPNALWLVSDFVSKSWWHSLMLFVMYQFFRITTQLENRNLPDWERRLSEQGLREIDQKLFFGSFVKTALYKIDG